MVYIISILIIFGIMFLIVWLSERSRMKKLTCKQCGQIYDEDDIEYETTSTDIKKSSSTSSMTENHYAIVRFKCTCSICGKVKEFTKKFCIYHYHINYNSNSSPHENYYDLRSKINKFLNLKFKEKAERRQARKREQQIIKNQAALAKSIALKEENNSISKEVVESKPKETKTNTKSTKVEEKETSTKTVASKKKH